MYILTIYTIYAYTCDLFVLNMCGLKLLTSPRVGELHMLRISLWGLTLDHSAVASPVTLELGPLGPLLSQGLRTTGPTSGGMNWQYLEAYVP